VVKVATLVTVPEGASLHNCTLFFNTVATGFPTTRVEVFDNGNTNEISDYLRHKCQATGCRYIRLSVPIHHAKWIEERVRETEGKLVIIDPDTCFWESVEGFSFPTLLAGYYVPLMWNEYSHCISYPRFHSSFLWIKDCRLLLEAVRQKYPQHDDYSNCDPFMPSVKFVEGRACFWDTCSVLYHMFGGTRFIDIHLDAYDHLNSASFYQIVFSRLEKRFEFEALHKKAEHDFMSLRGMHREITRYYAEMHEKAKKILSQNERRT
jgi:hypothetical protein